MSPVTKWQKPLASLLHTLLTMAPHPSKWKTPPSSFIRDASHDSLLWIHLKIRKKKWRCASYDVRWRSLFRHKFLHKWPAPVVLHKVASCFQRGEMETKAHKVYCSQQKSKLFFISTVYTQWCYKCKCFVCIIWMFYVTFTHSPE